MRMSGRRLAGILITSRKRRPSARPALHRQLPPLATGCRTAAGACTARPGRPAPVPPRRGDLLDLVRSVARIGGGPAHVFYAPMILDDAESAAAIRRQADIAEAFALVPSVTMALVAIGAWAPGLSTIYDAITPAERDIISSVGVFAEMAGVFIGADGRPVETPLDSRMIVTPASALQRIPCVLSVAFGVAKSPAVSAVIRGGMVHGLVTHASLARALLNHADG